ncbi:YugN-like family protein [Anoxybacillus pushchinoensis]|uniref:YugN-like family protein n=1 Tax=Anoxybacillus pushchinoensis TaxID=150248 RepID=A0A1I0SU70_9BACL|nr:YugN-like family protein [Anoxybacillus pushchinoensis]SFA43052.1 YugN-like family protein [Anoxybacillus pushchinoensis]
MIEIPSRLEGKTFLLNVLEQQLKPLGYVIGGNWDYDHGSFDYKMADDVGYQFLRLPFVAIDGQLDSYGATVELRRPYVLCHKYQRGLDDNVHVGNVSASFNQFSEPEDSDATVPDKYVSMAKMLVKDVEDRLLH